MNEFKVVNKNIKRTAVRDLHIGSMIHIIYPDVF